MKEEKEINEDFSNIQIKTSFTYGEVTEPWKRVNRLSFLLGASAVANIIFSIGFLLKQFL